MVNPAHHRDSDHLPSRALPNILCTKLFENYAPCLQHDASRPWNLAVFKSIFSLMQPWEVPKIVWKGIVEWFRGESGKKHIKAVPNVHYCNWALNSGWYYLHNALTIPMDLRCCCRRRSKHVDVRWHCDLTLLLFEHAFCTIHVVRPKLLPTHQKKARWSP